MEGAEQFYRDLRARGVQARIGMEASGYTRWFEQLMAELSFELWIGDAAAISRKRVRKQKTDKQDAELLLQLLIEDRFPRIWVPTPRGPQARNQANTRAVNKLRRTYQQLLTDYNLLVDDGLLHLDALLEISP
jgi:transposase